jgi:hypothetical protein
MVAILTEYSAARKACSDPSTGKRISGFVMAYLLLGKTRIPAALTGFLRAGGIAESPVCIHQE